MPMESAAHQMPAQAGRVAVGRGESTPTTASDEAHFTRSETGSAGQVSLLTRALARGNMVLAWERVQANRGSAGPDGLSIKDTEVVLKTRWPQIRDELLNGLYTPQPVRRVQIPKPGGGMRELGIPSVTDRLIQQALLQVLQPLIDPTFSEFSYGFRPGRRAHTAVLQAQRYVQDGWQVVVDVDLEKFFDRVNHDILMERLARRIEDRRLLRLIRSYLEAGVMMHGVVAERWEGTPQGGPLSPFLANVLLDEVDKELERRGHSFARYADDCNIYVRSRRAGERVMAAMQEMFQALRLKINAEKSAVAQASSRKFLGFSFWYGPSGKVCIRVAAKAREKMKAEVRFLTRRTIGRSLTMVVEDLRSYLIGWKNYFKLADTPGVFRDLDQWIRHRLRALQLKHWKRGTTMFRELRTRGASESLAAKIAAHGRRWWHTSGKYLHIILKNRIFDEMGVPRLAT